MDPLPVNRPAGPGQRAVSTLPALAATLASGIALGAGMALALTGAVETGLLLSGLGTAVAAGLWWTRHRGRGDDPGRRDTDVAHRRLQWLAQAMPVGIAYFDAAQQCLFANEGAHACFGAGDPSIPLTWQNVLAGAAPDTPETVRRRLHLGERQTLDVRPPGSVRRYALELVPHGGPDGSALGFGVFAFDVTESRDAAESRADTERRLKAITDNIPALISYVDTNECVTFANAMFQTWMGKNPAELVGKQQIEVLGEAMYAARRPYLLRALAGERLTFTSEVPRPNGTLYTQATFVPDVLVDGTVAGIFVMVMDITALKQVERELDRLARVDPLTQLANRRQLEQVLTDALRRMGRDGPQVALLYLDVDRFKAINDTYGHPAGDAVLRELAARLTASVRATDTVGRLAGDEFVILLEGCNAPDDAARVAEKIGDALRRPMDIAGQALDIRASIGIALATGTDAPAELLARGDQALYAAKRAGRGTYAVFEGRGPAEEGEARGR